ncbi:MULTISPECIES: hypothetical protein [unclassified Paenibacillus]|uniref:hypothetical protein n=1 Tax=unclassified Paenibacillus TaxID=185978 RepID=UPI001AE9CB41|nr:MULTISPECIES: hypothetical protein [unclassified Paenibacillus]MBP1156027.1 hypothetical protein [Paenibacillus sp. PvP091]MBP1168587.1 hypothetical protein [Paenibacillus sp. PvR098]MBP2439615.1 hypothetical protein [Paenibacillus sp. PvP052]
MNISGMIRGLIGETQMSEPRALELKPGQVVKGKVVQLLSDQEAMVQINGVKVRAQLETPLRQGEVTMLQVQPESSGGQVTLKPMQSSSVQIADVSLGDVLKGVGLQDTPANRQLVQLLHQAGVALTKENVSSFVQLQSGMPSQMPPEDWVPTAVIAFQKGLPLTPESVASLRQAMQGPPFHKALENISLLVRQELDGETEYSPQTRALLEGVRQLVQQVRDTAGQLLGKAADGSTAGPVAQQASSAQGAGGSGAVAGAQQASVTQGASSSGAGAVAQQASSAQGAGSGGAGAVAQQASSAQGAGSGGAGAVAQQASSAQGAGSGGAGAVAQQASSAQGADSGGAGAVAQQASSAQGAGSGGAGAVAQQASVTQGAGGSGAGAVAQQASVTQGAGGSGAGAVAQQASVTQGAGGNGAGAGTQQASSAQGAGSSGALAGAQPPADSVPVQSSSDQQEGGQLLGRLMKALGMDHEHQAIKQLERTVQEQQLNVGSLSTGSQGEAAKAADSLKSVLMQLSQANDAPQSLKDVAQQAVQQITGQQLLLSQDRSAMFSHVTLFVPLIHANGEQTAAIHIQSRRGKNGSLDESNCRLVFDLRMKALGDTMVDVQVVNRIVSLHVHNDLTFTRELLEANKDDITQGLNSIGYQFISMKCSPYPSKTTEALESSEAPGSPTREGNLQSVYTQQRYKGVDIRV